MKQKPVQTYVNEDGILVKVYKGFPARAEEKMNYNFNRYSIANVGRKAMTLTKAGFAGRHIM